MEKVLLSYMYRQQWREKYVTLEEVARWMREGKYEGRVNAVRSLQLTLTDYGMGDGQEAAVWLPKVKPATGPNGAYTGLVLLSFPVQTGVEALEMLRRQVNQWPQTLMSFVGATGRTLEILIPYKLTDGQLPTGSKEVALFQQHAYRRAAEYARNATGISPVEVLHDGNEQFDLSFDPLVYLNPTAMAITMNQPTEPMTEVSAIMTDKRENLSLDTTVLPGYTRREMEIVMFNSIFKRLSFSELKKLEDHLMRLAVECCKVGIDQELATLLTIEALRSHDREILVRGTFETAYSKHKLGMKNAIEKSVMNQVLLEEFLRRRYMFRRNRVTGDVEVQEKYRYELWWKPMTQEVRNDINNAAIREGIKVWPQDIDRILVSGQTEEYDPVRQWLSSLPEWDGRDRLGEMASRVKTKSAEWQDNFKIWMRSMVSQWRSGVDAMYGAQMVLMLVGAQGTRKSTFMRMLLPRELMQFYIDRIDFTNQKEATRALHRFLLINIDEYDQVSKAQTAFLKHLIQRTDVKERKMYTTTYEQQQRYAAFCATTNSLVPLKDESGSRRYLVVEVTDVIDTDTQGDKSIDYRQLYAQIVAEIERGEEYAFTGNREQRIQEQNRDYYEEPNVVSLFEDHYRSPRNEDEDVLLMSATELLTALKLDPKNRANATMLGTYLKRNGYQRGDGNDRRRYKVVLAKD